MAPDCKNNFEINILVRNSALKQLIIFYQEKLGNFQNAIDIMHNSKPLFSFGNGIVNKLNFWQNIKQFSQL